MEDTMTELRPESLTLLDAARDGDEPTRADRERVRAALAARLASGATLSAASAAAPRAAAKGAQGASLATGAKLALILALAAAVPVVGVRLAPSHPSGELGAFEGRRGGSVSHGAGGRPDDPFVGSNVRPMPDPPTDLASSATPQPPAAAPDPTSDLAPDAVSPTRGRGKPFGAPREGSALSSGLEVEIPLIAEARAALASGSPARAYEPLARHARRFPRGVLAQEREVLLIQALCALGRAPEARDHERRFREAFPDSPHAAALGSTCAATPAARAREDAGGSEESASPF
jgi:hypothetical protein